MREPPGVDKHESQNTMDLAAGFDLMEECIPEALAEWAFGVRETLDERAKASFLARKAHSFRGSVGVTVGAPAAGLNPVNRRLKLHV